MDWTYLVLLRKNCSKNVVDRLKRIYSENYSIVVVNNVMGKKIPNHRGALKQGDIPSMYYFLIGLDSVLNYLERRLRGVPVFKLPVAGPQPEPAPRRGRGRGAGRGGGQAGEGARLRVVRMYISLIWQ